MRTVSLRNGDSVTIRRWQEHDIPKLYQLMEEVGREGQAMLGARLPFGIEQLYQQFYYTVASNHLTLVAVKPNGDICGWLRCDRSMVPWMGHNATIWMGIAAADRGQGLGEQLLQEAFAWAAEQGIERLELGVRGSNKPALALYKKMGFHEEGRKMRAIKTEKGYDDDIWMGVFLNKKGQPKKLKQSVPTKKRSSKTGLLRGR
ncbi:GNAT family N-acetyltransferase [Effusibacillus pohliae]|uniref:GNAT family N-acetyltransferase n=1 Tax=Effusibacillus pohliae TaxID=232270 RepID=UPI000375869B|nr:GNAT family N-acetyltransferase [Effusibacillus pohliae]